VATHSAALRNAQANALTTQIDAGSAAGRLRVYTGSKPATPETAASGTLLADIALNDPAFGASAAGVVTLDVTPEPADSSANNTGTAGYARFTDSDGNGVLDCSVGTSGAEVNLNTLSVVSGVAVTVTSCTYTVPAGS
jgi:hypothetical protein